MKSRINMWLATAASIGSAAIANVEVFTRAGYVSALLSAFNAPGMVLIDLKRQSFMGEKSREGGVKCQSSQGCGTGQMCIEQENEKICHCPVFSTLEDGKCVDIDTCLTLEKCSKNATCTNGLGYAPTCTCNEGFFGDGYICASVDDPKLGDCLPGYTKLNGECLKIGTCTALKLGCGANAVCANTVAGEEKCVCSSFYEGDGYSCNPIDACTSDENPCSPEATCSDGMGQLPSCTCNKGYFGYGGDCTKVEGNESPPDAPVMFTFSENSTVKVVTRVPLERKLEMKLGDCYSLNIDFSKVTKSTVRHHDQEIMLDSSIFTEKNQLVVLVHRDGDKLSTMVFTAPPEGEYNLTMVDHDYQQCPFSEARLHGDSIKSTSAVEIFVTDNLELIA